MGGVGNSGTNVCHLCDGRFAPFHRGEGFPTLPPSSAEWYCKIIGYLQFFAKTNRKFEIPGMPLDTPPLFPLHAKFPWPTISGYAFRLSQNYFSQITKDSSGDYRCNCGSGSISATLCRESAHRKSAQDTFQNADNKPVLRNPDGSSCSGRGTEGFADDFDKFIGTATSAPDLSKACSSVPAEGNGGENPTQLDCQTGCPTLSNPAVQQHAKNLVEGSEEGGGILQEEQELERIGGAFVADYKSLTVALVQVAANCKKNTIQPRERGFIAVSADCAGSSCTQCHTRGNPSLRDLMGETCFPTPPDIGN